MMDETKTYRRDLLAAVHETASDLHDAGTMPKRTLRRFDEMCLTPVKPMDAGAIRALRERERVSQAVLAKHLNVTTGLISQWERGEKHPSGSSLKLLSLVERKGLKALRRATRYPSLRLSQSNESRPRQGNMMGEGLRCGSAAFSELPDSTRLARGERSRSRS